MRKVRKKDLFDEVNISKCICGNKHPNYRFKPDGTCCVVCRKCAHSSVDTRSPEDAAEYWNRLQCLYRSKYINKTGV